MATLKLEIITPDTKVFEGDVEFVELPGAEGDMGVFPQHEALVTELNAGELRYTQKGKVEILAIGEGFAEITGTSVAILTDGAVNEKEIDEKAAEVAVKRAEAARNLPMDHRFITTAFDLPGYKIAGTLGLVRGIVVRSRSVVGQFGAQLQTIFGGNITIYTDLCERARLDAYNQMAEHAAALGANGVIGVRYDATEMMPGITEVLCYGTAVLVQSET
jgi:ATP synthase F1 epsilon subunit